MTAPITAQARCLRCKGTGKLENPTVQRGYVVCGCGGTGEVEVELVGVDALALAYARQWTAWQYEDDLESAREMWPTVSSALNAYRDASVAQSKGRINGHDTAV